MLVDYPKPTKLVDVQTYYIHASSSFLQGKENSLKTLLFMVKVLYHVCYVNPVMMIAELLTLVHNITYYIQFSSHQFLQSYCFAYMIVAFFSFLYLEFPTTQAILAIFCKHPCRIKDVHMSVSSCDLIPQEEISFQNPPVVCARSYAVYSYRYMMLYYQLHDQI
jgi:hypothetical protein